MQMNVMTQPTPISRERLAAFGTGAYWYHTLELAPGVVTEGTYDHRPFLEQYRLPESLEGWTVLDVGATDGFFSFEFERRGAARVLAIDRNPCNGSVGTEVSPVKLETYARKYQRMADTKESFSDVYDALGTPRGHQLLAARALRGSRIEYRQWDAYNLADLGESFDLVFCGSLIEHLKNPLAALEQLARVTRRLCVVALSSARPSPPWPGGIAELVDKWFRVPLAHPRRSLQYVGNCSGGSFFQFYPETFRDALLASGFARVDIQNQFALPNRRARAANHHVIYHCRTAV